MNLYRRVSHRSVSMICAGIAVGLLAAGSSQATQVTLSFSGTYNTHMDSVFGLSGEAVPYNYLITYDTALDTDPFYAPIGGTVDGYTTIHEWYGYSTSGITATSLTFGTKTWTVDDFTTNLMFDTDISLSTPTRCRIYIRDSDHDMLSLGASMADAVNIYLGSNSVVEEMMGGMGDSYPITFGRTVVPEPSSVCLLTLGGLAMLRRRSRNHCGTGSTSSAI